MALVDSSPRHVFLLASGGFDSTALICYYYLRGYIIHPYKMRYDSKQIDAEEAALKNIMEFFSMQVLPMTTIDIPLVNTSTLASDAEDVPAGVYSEVDSKSLMVPGRNLAFISILANVAEAYALNNPDAKVFLSLGVHESDWDCYPDCRPEFIKTLQHLLHLGTEMRITLDAPFLFDTKGGILSTITRNGEFALPAYMKYALNSSYSCYRGGEVHCGTCPTCIERHEAFMVAFGDDPTRYLRTPKLPKRPPMLTSVRNDTDSPLAVVRNETGSISFRK